MNAVLHKEQLSQDVFLMRLRAPLIAEERRAGQFVILSVDEEFGERIPLTIADADVGEGSITIIFQRVGQTTDALAGLEPGDSVAAVLGPLGTPTHIENFGTAVCLGGGIGIAPLFPIVQALKQAGNRLTVILGARTKGLVILEERMRGLADELIVCTDDGSYGRKALVTEPLKECCQRTPKPDLAVAIGPPLMMKFCAEATRPFGVKTVVSLNTIMVDGTGMCGGCRITVGGKTKFVCVDGPEFDGHQVDFAELVNRLSAYRPQEKDAHDRWHRDHQCRLDTHQRT
ncbi:MAG: Dihydroorotate dehydrogenase B (NAD(+)), electron transfer subunit [Lentisphaerae bacterium ADurb.BinA184]|nr:MAG: Dihydroorotate dehydrogenase B (NAD(+)), electron transfer subunit [Lentisphaerae bacterium ADurb.BinA184]